MPTANSFLIGADPEFAVLNNSGGVVPLTLPQGKLGTDHSAKCVELRPSPSLSATELCEDMFAILSRRELVPYRQFKWKAGAVAGGVPLGGHIHFDVPFNSTFRGDVATVNRLAALDRVQTWFEGLEFWPATEAAERIRQGYGQITNPDRARSHSGHLEYRTPPSWLFSRKLTHLALTAFKLALVDPQHTLDTLHDSQIAPMTKLRRFLAGFALTDDDASTIHTAILADGNRLRSFRGDPLADIKEAWAIPPAPTETAAQATIMTRTQPLVGQVTTAAQGRATRSG